MSQRVFYVWFVSVLLLALCLGFLNHPGAADPAQSAQQVQSKSQNSKPSSNAGAPSGSAEI